MQPYSIKNNMTCPVCNEKFLPTHKDKERRKYCSWNCFQQGQKIENLEVTFWERVNKTETCWIWTGSSAGANIKGKLNYGYFFLGRENGVRKKVMAHRFSWELVNGPVPEGMMVLHNCPDGKDNPLCCNPKHLWIGDQADNMKDKVKKGRQATGERHGTARLTVEKVHEIDRLSSQGLNTYEIADIIGVSQFCIWRALTRKNWKNVPKLS